MSLEFSLGVVRKEKRFRVKFTRAYPGVGM
jgi:hypothetical protein